MKYKRVNPERCEVDMKRTICLICCLMVFLSIFIIELHGEEITTNNELNLINDYNMDTASYSAYLKLNKNNSYPNETEDLDLSVQGYPIETILETPVIKIIEDNSIKIKFNVEEPGLYNIKIVYIADIGNNAEIESYIKLNGKTPFKEAEKMIFNKIYIDNGDVKKDNRGNDIRPEQIELQKLQETYLQDYMGYEQAPYYFNFTNGDNEIEIGCARGGILLSKITLTQFNKTKSYNEYIKDVPLDAKDSSGQYIKINAEKPMSKSAPTLYSNCDRTSAFIDPKPNGKIILNVFGGLGFNKPGQWVDYKFDTNEAGYYNITFKYKQNIANGITSYRKIMIDEKVLFSDMDALGFNYNVNWANNSLGGNKKIYFSKGTHRIRIEVVLGDYRQIVQSLEQSVMRLNSAYRESIMFLSATPDVYRDYDVKNNLQQVIQTFNDEKVVLKEISDQLYGITNEKNEKTAFLDRFAFQLNDFTIHPETLPKRIEQFKNNISGMGAMITALSVQPLALDFISIHSPDVIPPKAEAGFFKNTLNEMNNFLYTFINDYKNLGNVYSGTDDITAWVTTGRDQATVLKRIIDDKFSQEEKIGVNLKLVQPSMILPAIVSGIGPDVVVQIGYGDPVNYALRGAILNLNQFKDIASVKDRFTKSSLVPLTFQKELYGLPETENFLMMFYRKDILSQLKIEVPQTWKQTVNVITELQKNNLLFGLPQGVGANLFSYGMLLYQNGGSIYSKDSYISGINTEVSINAFTFLTDLYTNYKIPIAYDALTRFRVGEMPILIADYGFYNNLQVGAPEIRNLWDFTLVPGTPQLDGTIDRSVLNTGLSCSILKNTKKPEESWKFIKWWTSSPTQVMYGRDMEMILGPSARVATANIEAIKDLPWSTKNAQLITMQREWVKGLENVPGGYFTSRHIDNAFRKVVITKQNPRDTIREYVRVIDKEIEDKCKELNISINRIT